MPPPICAGAATAQGGKNPSIFRNIGGPDHGQALPQKSAGLSGENLSKEIDDPSSFETRPASAYATWNASVSKDEGGTLSLCNRQRLSPDSLAKSGDPMALEHVPEKLIDFSD